MLIQKLIQVGCSKMSVFNDSELAEFDKRLISAEFAKPDVESVLESPRYRIIVATDAMGMGIYNPDIRLDV